MYAYQYADSLETEVMSATPLRLIQLLYKGALESVSAARACLRSGDIAGRSRQITKAQAIVTELAVSLNRGEGGEVAKSLAELYDYAQRQLAEANFHQADAPLADVEKLLVTLAEAWDECIGESESVPVMALAAGAAAAYTSVECFG